MTHNLTNVKVSEQESFSLESKLQMRIPNFHIYFVSSIANLLIRMVTGTLGLLMA